MNKYKFTKKDLVSLLKNLRQQDLEEVKFFYKKNWKKKLLADLNYREIQVIKVKSKYGRDVILAIGGFAERNFYNDKVACVWLLTSKNVFLYKKFFFNELKKYLEVAHYKYKIIYNYIYKSNFTAVSFLKKLGFSFENNLPSSFSNKNDFQFFYKIGGVS